nr:hypothetical protein [Escherichia coli]
MAFSHTSRGLAKMQWCCL